MDCMEEVLGGMEVLPPSLPPMQSGGESDVIIIGSGIGGLLISALLARDGYSVTVLEKLNFIGGKYSSFPFRGREVPTGAHHSIPHGRHSLIYTALRELGMTIDLSPCFPAMTWRAGGREYIFPVRIRDWFRMVFREPFLYRLIPVRERLAMMWGLFWYKMGLNPSSDTSVKNLVDRFTADSDFHGAVDKTVQYAFGVGYDELPGLDLLRVFRKYGYVLQAEVTEGMRHIVTSLAEYVTSHGGSIHTSRSVERIVVEGGRAVGVTLRTGEKLYARRGVVSNTGMKATASFVGDGALPDSYKKKMADARPAWGISHISLLDAPRLCREGVVMLVGRKRICAVAEPVVRGKSILLAYQVLNPWEDVQMQAIEGKEEFLGFAGLHRQEDYIMSVFQGGWPGVELAAVAGQIGEARIGHNEAGMRNFWMIGADSTGMGIAGDMIGDSVRTLYAELKKELRGA